MRVKKNSDKNILSNVNRDLFCGVKNIEVKGKFHSMKAQKPSRVIYLLLLLPRH